MKFEDITQELNMTMSASQQLRQQTECALYENNERVLQGLSKNFEALFDLIPHLEARWRVWTFGVERLYFDNPVFDIRLSQDSPWYQLDAWQGPIASETDIYHRRDGAWTQKKERQYIFFNKLPSSASEYLYEIATYGDLFKFDMYGNLHFFETKAQHWEKIAAKNVTQKLYDSFGEDALLSCIIDKNNYAEALTEVYPLPGLLDKIKAQLEKEKLENGVATKTITSTQHRIQKI